MKTLTACFGAGMAFFCAAPALATPVDDAKLQTCLQRAEASPDMAYLEADAWTKSGGGDKARLCRAFAQFHRGEYALAAQEFSTLAAARDKKDKKHAVSLHTQAAISFMRSNNHRRAESEYDAALKLEPQDPDIWMDRATERAANEKYWDALDDLKHALHIMPEMPEAYKLRGQIWKKLGLDSKARDDFEKATVYERGLAHPDPNQKP